MDNNFQTSFIPKKPLAEERVVAPANTGGTSIVSFLAVLVFIAALAASGGVYFYRASLKKTIASQVVQLAAARDAFEPSLITELKRLDRRIGSSTDIVGKHIIVSPIFQALELNTLKSIQFTRFTYTVPADPKMPVTVKMSGKARDYASIALESDQLATNKNIHNPIFANLSLDEQTGMVSFELTFSVDADLVRFSNHIDTFTAAAATTAPIQATTATTTTATSTGAR